MIKEYYVIDKNILDNRINQLENLRNEFRNDLKNNPLPFANNKAASVTGANPADKLKEFNNELLKANSINFVQNQKTVWGDLNSIIMDSNNLVKSFTDGLMGISDALVSIGETGKASFKDMITSMLDGLRKIMVGLLAQSIGNLIVSGTRKGIIGLAGAVAGISILTGLWKSKVPKFATGGIVGGVSYTGDKVPALLNSGEMILNKGQQSRLFSMLNSGANGGEVVFRIGGNELIGVLKKANYINSRIS